MEILGRAAAIRARCLDCCYYQPAEVSRCPVKTYPLWPYRRGKRSLAKDFPGEDISIAETLGKSTVYDLNGRIKDGSQFK